MDSRYSVAGRLFTFRTYFYIDGDKDFPSICGTGTEDYFGGAYNFEDDGKYVEYANPYQGLSKVGKTDEAYISQRYFDIYPPISSKNKIKIL